MAGDLKAAVAAFVALWTSAEDKVGTIDLTALPAFPRKSWGDDEIDEVEVAIRKQANYAMVERLVDAIDAALAGPPDATHGPDCYLITAVKAALGARYEAGWEKRIEAYAKASGWNGGDLEDPAAALVVTPPPPQPPSAPAPSAGPPATAASRPLPGLGGPPPGGSLAAAPGTVRALPGQAIPPATVQPPPAQRLVVNKARAAEEFGRPAVQRFFATLTAAFASGNTVMVEKMRGNLDHPANSRVYGDDAIATLQMYIDIRLGRVLGINMTPAELHTAFGLNPP